MDKEEIYKFYLSDRFNPILPDKANFRHFRFRLPDGSWRKVKEQITKKELLVKWIIKCGAVDCFYSTAQWARPEVISCKGHSGTYVVADNLLLSHDLVFDIDAKTIDLNGLELARKSTNNLFEAMKKFSRFEFQYLSYTGTKGFRLSYKDNCFNLPSEPKARFDYIENDRKIFIEKLLSYIKEHQSSKEYYKINTFFDVNVTTNVMNVVRVLGTVHSQTGFISTEIPSYLLRRSVNEIINHVPFIGKERPAIPKREMRRADEEQPHPRLLQSASVVSGLATSPPFIYFITNKVLGCKGCFIPIFIYQKEQKYRDQVISLQKNYKLGKLYVFESGGKIIVVSLKIMQRRQLQKLLNKSTSQTKYTFMRHRRIFSPLLINLIDKIEAPYTGNLSRGHKLYVSPFSDTKSTTYVGWPKVEMIRGEHGKRL